MKFEESSLTGYLVKNLEPLTEADPVILAEYVATLLKKDKPTKELQKLCTENLVDFLGHDTKSFITKLFQALEDGSIVTSAESLDSIRQVEPSATLTTVDPSVQNSLSPKPEKLSSSSLSDSEEKEVTDDDDDDRNHKHRRRETRSLSSDKDAQEQIFRRPNRKRDKPFENGLLFLGSDPQPSEYRKEYNFAPLENAKFEKRRPGLAPLPRAPDLGQRTRLSQPFRGDPGPRFDLSTSLGRLPIGRGRGRNAGPWNQHDSRFSSVETLDFSSQMAPLGSAPPSLFPGRGLPNAASAQSASWGAFGLIHGLPNGGLDTLHPLGLQGTLRPPINPSINIGIPRQRCRDFEERGFCLRGDMCPMEHGVNRIVVEDVQSLSQFNLPVSIPSAHLLGMQGGPGPLPPVTAPSSLLTNNKSLHGKSSKPGMADDGLGLNGVLSGSGAAGEADLYDPDQPLWNNDCPETSERLLRLPSPKIHDTEPLWDDDSDRHNFKFAEGNDSEHTGRSLTAAVGSQGATSSVWGRIGNSGNRLEMTGKTDSSISAMTHLGNEKKEDQEETLNGTRGTAHQGKRTIMTELAPTQRSRADSGRNAGRQPQKALRTLFVNGIPLKNNKREALLSHFQKFGEVIDIYIPLNSERAFVQFSKREDAEAALKAPDAVMGNRFIKLWWANRDSIPDEGESSGNVVSAPARSAVAATVPSQPTSDRGKENIPSAAPKPVSMPGPDVPVAVAVPPRTVGANGPKAAPPLQKKLESLELLKEELRLKQEMLDQKRNDFRRQLDKLEKQAITVKSEATCEQAVKRHKVEMVNDVAKAATPRPTNPITTGARPEAEKTQDKRNPVENIVSPSAKTNSTTLLQSPRSLKQPSRSALSIGTPFMVNRFKLDNRPTSFRILLPLPANIANVAALKEHFSSFGDLSTVELEHPEDHASSPTGSKPSHNCSARITFTTRRSAERAFQNGKCWQGHNLQFMWSTTSSNSSTDHGGVEISQSPTPKGPLDAGIMAESSSPSTGKLKCSGISPAADTARSREPENAESSNGGLECLPREAVEVCPSGSPTTSSNKRPYESDFPIAEDGLNVCLSQ
ncbi:zinc finger CCCH domain-containing protein 27 [Magnolia sinica]|uniref:zinc finger CCCH domain-containing protein 27 n=1 Tax=Magnolia sinica TaxID=86752 RepID=UPI0026596417|nr:zinc finger CCCH domain-containing protein 27 [Magnolia sinica]